MPHRRGETAPIGSLRRNRGSAFRRCPPGWGGLAAQTTGGRVTRLSGGGGPPSGGGRRYAERPRCTTRRENGSASGRSEDAELIALRVGEARPRDVALADGAAGG